MQLNLANSLTLFRIVLIPVLVIVFMLPFKWTNYAAALIFMAAAVTDWLDGWVARAFKQSSPFGAFLDPVADKLMVTTVLVLLVKENPTWFMSFFAAVIVGREVAVSALREWMASIGQRATVRVAGIGKIKTIFQMVAMTMLLWKESLWGLPIYLIGEVLLAIAAVLTIWSALMYLRAAWPLMRGGSAGDADADGPSA